MSITGFGDAIADGLELAAEKAIEASLTASFPFLAFPPLQFILDWLVSRELKKLEAMAEVVAYLVYSHAVVNHEVGAMNDAAAQEASAKASGEKDALAKAIQARIDAARNLGHLNNVN